MESEKVAASGAGGGNVVEPNNSIEGEGGLETGGGPAGSSEADLQRMLARERIAKQICSELNNFVELKDTLITVLGHLRNLTQCEAVGIRLHDGGDYPYFTYSGFPESFIQKENSLCSKEGDGERIPRPDGKGYVLDCMCGNVIRGRFDPCLPFFSSGGSFFSNSTSALLASTSEEDRQGRTRNRCNASGYESVALVPVKARETIIGLIQLNDKRRGMFREDTIGFLEMIGEQIGLAVHNSLIYSKLKHALEEVKVLRGYLPICAKCKKIRDDHGYWHRVECYISERSEAQFTHGYCPECAEEAFGEIREMLEENGVPGLF